MTAPDARANQVAAQSVRTAPPERKLATACPRCGAAVPSEASDFCEACSAHLYPGHCVFCLEPFADGQGFCRKCGLPPEGLVCGACGTFSRFDFCPNPDCGAGLTPRAAAEMERISTDPVAVEAFAELDEIGEILEGVGSGGSGGSGGSVGSGGSGGSVGSVGRGGSVGSGGTDAFESVPASPASPATSASSASPAASASSPRPSLKALRALAASARTAEDKAKLRAVAEQAAQDALNTVATRSFPSAQEARAAGTALEVALRFRVVSQRLEVIAWRCNAFSCEHPMPGGMAQCSDPSRGGVPITRVITEMNEGHAEFKV